MRPPPFVTQPDPFSLRSQGNWLDASNGAEPHRAFCLETQMTPDAVNQPAVFGDVILRPGQTYKHVALHAFT